MAEGSFFERTRYLEEQVGEGDIVAGCTVNQPYAQDQHETLTYYHDDGRARYLGGPLFENIVGTMQEIARRTITETGSDLEDAMKDFADTMADDYVGRQAPKKTGLLSESGEPWVTDGGVEIYRRPAAPREPNSTDYGWDDLPNSNRVDDRP